MVIVTIIIFLIVLAVLIFVHELGHFLFARAAGIRVDAFKIGFGPKLVAWKRGETEYGINLIPFGGFVKIHGENPDDENTYGPDAARSFVNKPRWKQALVLLAGILFNFIFAWLLYSGAFLSGVTATTDGFERYSKDFTDPRIMITDVSPSAPASKAGLVAGDVIKEVSVPAFVSSSGTNSNSVSKDLGGANGSALNVGAIQDLINGSKGAPITFTYLRSGKLATATVAAVTGVVLDKYAIGIAMDNVVTLKLPFFSALWEGLNYTGVMIQQTAVGLYTFVGNIFHGAAKLSDVSGPVGIAGIVGDAAHLGFLYLVMITALISINLGVINLIPFPALDGGRVLFVLIEGIARRRIPAKFTNWVNLVGFGLLMLLMIVVTFNDVVKLFK
jgi:regulator of sigma E protease